MWGSWASGSWRGAADKVRTVGRRARARTSGPGPCLTANDEREPKLLLIAAVLAIAVALPGAAAAITITVDWNPANPLVSGLNARVVFDWTAGTNMLDVTLINTSTNVTGVPILHVGQNTANPLIGGANSIQLLTGVGFNLPGSLLITGGTAVIGSGSASVNFDPNGQAPPVSLGPGDDTSHEWGAGANWLDPANLFGQTVNLVDFVTTVASGQGAIQFPGTNVDGPDSIDGPKGGLVACSSCSPADLGGLGAVRNSALLHLALSGNLTSDTSWTQSDVFFVFGSHDIIGRVAEPDTLLFIGSALVGVGFMARKRWFRHIKR